MRKCGWVPWLQKLLPRSCKSKMWIVNYLWELLHCGNWKDSVATHELIQQLKMVFVPHFGCTRNQLNPMITLIQFGVRANGVRRNAHQRKKSRDVWKCVSLMWQPYATNADRRCKSCRCNENVVQMMWYRLPPSPHGPLWCTRARQNYI